MSILSVERHGVNLELARSRRFSCVLTRDGRPWGDDLQLEVFVEGNVDPLTGMIVNLVDLDRWIDEVVGLLDYRDLNAVERFGGAASMEKIARFCFEEIRARVKESSLKSVGLEAHSMKAHGLEAGNVESNSSESNSSEAAGGQPVCNQPVCNQPVASQAKSFGSSTDSDPLKTNKKDLAEIERETSNTPRLSRVRLRSGACLMVECMG